MKKVDVQYAIEAIENISLHNRWDRDLYGEKVHKTVIKALEKQIPKKPNNIYCPICKRPLRKAKEDIGYTGKVKKRKADNYCPGCGQALDWSSENE